MANQMDHEDMEVGGAQPPVEVVERLKERLKTKKEKSETLDTLQTELESRTFNSKLINKDILKLLHEIEHYVELELNEHPQRDQSDEEKLKIKVHELVCKVNGASCKGQLT